MLDDILQELQTTWDLTNYEIGHIKDKMVEYAFACKTDPVLAEELDILSKEIPTNIIYHYFGGQPFIPPDDVA